MSPQTIFRSSARFVTAALAAASSIALALSLGCRDESSGERVRRPAASGDAKSGLFESVAQNLDHLEEFETEPILKQTCDRLNQWYMQEKPRVAWKRDPLVDGLTADLLKNPEVVGIEQVQFQNPRDAWFLQEAVWLRDISAGARGDQFQDLAVAQRLFDWTIRNIQLEPADASALPHQPFETLLLGRGTAIDRAWIFILLARQQNLDVVMLGLGDAEGKSVRPWLPALVVGDELYLFDTRLGLPIAGPEPNSVATLAQVLADEKLLRRLDLDAEHPYPIRPADLKHVVAYVEGSPASLSQRMAVVESRLTGKHKARLTSPANLLAERLKKAPNIAEVRLWPVPFEVSAAKVSQSEEQLRLAMRESILYQAMPTLKRGRALHFKGQFEGTEGAKAAYLNARPPERYLEEFKLPPDVQKRLPPEAISKVEAAQILLMREGKQNASYWIGLIFFEQEDYPNAIDFFEKRTLGAEKSRWTSGARYNLARTYEAAGQADKAIELYEADTDGPQSHGNRLRARELKEKSQSPAQASPAAEQAPPAN